MPSVNHWQRQVWRWRGVDLFGLQEAATLHDGGNCATTTPKPAGVALPGYSGATVGIRKTERKGRPANHPYQCNPTGDSWQGVPRGKAFAGIADTTELLKVSCIRRKTIAEIELLIR